MICIGIALVFWMLVKLSQNYTTERTLSFSFTIPEEKTFSKAPPKDIQVEVEGTGWDLMFEYFSSPEISLSYDLEKDDQTTLSNTRLRNAVGQQLSARDITVLNVDVDNISLALEAKEEKRIPVKVNGHFSFAPEHHQPSPVKLTPDSISLTGPASLLKDIDFWPTDSLTLKDLKSTQVRNVNLQPPPPEITIDARQIEAVVEVEQYTEKSFFVALELQNEPPNDSLRYFPQRVKVSCIVGLSHYNEVKAEDFKLVADLMGTPIGNERNQVLIELKARPDFVKRVNFSPKTAEYFIVRKEEDASEDPNQKKSPGD